MTPRPDPRRWRENADGSFARVPWRQMRDGSWRQPERDEWLRDLDRPKRGVPKKKSG